MWASGQPCCAGLFDCLSVQMGHPHLSFKTGFCAVAAVFCLLAASVGKQHASPLLRFLQDSQTARFVAAICGLDGIAKKKEQEWVPCDPLAFAVAMNSSIILATDSVQCKVETQVVDQRGQTSFADREKDEGWPESHCGLVSKVCKVDTLQYAEVIENRMNHG